MELEPTPDHAIAEAARRAAAQAGVELLVGPGHDRGAWWRAGLADAVERGPGLPDDQDAPATYGVAPSPRSTRGTTRA